MKLQGCLVLGPPIPFVEVIILYMQGWSPIKGDAFFWINNGRFSSGSCTF